MSRLDKLRQLSKSKPNVDSALQVLKNEQLSFAEKFQQISKLEKAASDYELELFGDVHSSLQLLASSEDDFKLIAGE